MTTNGPGWLSDPTGRHEYRWWDGAAWSEVVADQGVEHRDPAGAQSAAAAAGGAAAPPAQAGAPVQSGNGYGPAGGYPQPQPAQPQHQPQGPASYPPSGGYGQASGSYPPGGGPSGGPTSPGSGPGGRSSAVTAGLVGLGALIVVLLVVLGVVIANRGGDDDPGTETETAGETGEPAETAVDPREALVTVADMPSGWVESEVTYPPGENQVCEPRLEPPTPPRESGISLDRPSPPGAISHRIVELEPDFAAEYLAEARRQAGECGTFETETNTGGETQSFAGTSELLTGPDIGDETVWYRIQIDYREPAPSAHDVLVVLDRHGGVVSGFTLSITGEQHTADDREMVEDLVQLAADRLSGGG
jgi:hypothetical protein